MKKAVVGISGGVDSSVCAYLLQEAGYEVIGCRMRSFDTPQSLEEERAAAEVAEKLKVPLITLDLREEFRREVIDYFAKEYMQGRTPNPCCICNRKVKWEALLQCMRKTGADFVATGHYADIETGVRYAVKAVSDRKDQSYALYNLTQEELSFTRFPLAGKSKEEIRDLARSAGLITAEKRDSMEICFIPDKDYASFLRVNYGCREVPGNFVSPDGTILGRHSGIIHYTVGQRKGLGIALGKKVFVKEIRPAANEVVLAGDEEVYTDELLITDVNLQKAERADGLYASKIKVRYADPGCSGTIRWVDNHLLSTGKSVYQICFDHPVRAAAPGQAAVCYDETGCILCGGTIL